MSKWRPNKDENIYVIPDIHGKYFELKLILNRILPLRKRDKLIFLGDYIDKDVNSHKIIDLCIELENEYKSQIIFIKGNHESMLIDAMKSNLHSDDYLLWMKNGGESTLYGYLDRVGNKMDNVYLFKRDRIKDIIPKKHQYWINNLRYFYETDKYKFVHGGCDPLVPLDKQNSDVLLWDRSLYNFVKKIHSFGENELSWNKTVVTGHNYEGPFIADKFMMLDCSKRGFLLVFELNSRTGFEARYGKKKLVEFVYNQYLG